MPTVGNRLLREAVAQLGVEAVAIKLQLSAPSVDEYRSGERHVGDALLLKLIDLLDSLKKPPQ